MQMTQGSEKGRVTLQSSPEHGIFLLVDIPTGQVRPPSSYICKGCGERTSTKHVTPSEGKGKDKVKFACCDEQDCYDKVVAKEISMILSL